MKTAKAKAQAIVDAFIWDKSRIAQYPICDSDLDLLKAHITQALTLTEDEIEDAAVDYGLARMCESMPKLIHGFEAGAQWAMRKLKGEL